MKTIEEAAIEFATLTNGMVCIDRKLGFDAGVRFAQQWISVEEALPEKFDVVLVIRKNEEKSICWYAGGNQFIFDFNNNRHSFYDVIYWRPIELKNKGMNIDVWTKSKKHQNAILILKTVEERVEYLKNNIGKPKASPMLKFEEMEDFYYPQLGEFIFRSFLGSSCEYKKSKDAVECAEYIMNVLKSNQYEDNA